MSAQFLYRGEVYEVKAGMTIRAALLKLEISPESVLTTRADELVTDNELVRDKDQIRLIPVISGGSSW